MLVPANLGQRSGLHDPPMNVTGQAGVILDTRGRLLELHGVPPQYDEAAGEPPATDWKPLFEAAGLDLARFTSAVPRWTPRAYADTRVAWTGSVAEHPGVTLRVEAAAYRGKPVYFSVVGPWTKPTRMVESSRSQAESLVSLLSRIIIVGIFVGAMLLAWRNARRGRGDRHGAWFAAALMFVLSFGFRVLRMSHVPDAFVETERFFAIAVAMPLFDAGSIWIVYMAVEPAIRRFWPDLLKGWSRLVSGRVRDPRVGRDVLYGVVAGMGLALIGTGHDILLPLLGSPPPALTQSDVNVWMGPNMSVGAVLLLARDAFHNTGIVLFAIVLLRMLLRSRLLTAVATVLIFGITNAGQAFGSDTPITDVVFAILMVMFVVAIIVRLGLLPALLMFFTYTVMTSLPLTSSFSAWYGRPSAVALLLVMGLAVAGFWLARGDAPLFGRPILDD
jgi:hypothetical protein